MKVYRDYGALNGVSAPNEFDVKRYTLVYQATHDGEQRLPFMNRSFISFSYGEKPDLNGLMLPVYIEDFNLIATIPDDRWEREAYSAFDDLTSDYDVIHGQFYWGTYFRATTLNFTLSTDGMTLHQLDDFKLWFRAGLIKELILAEHPNRAALARVASPPQLKLLPFEEKVTIPIATGSTAANELVTIRNYSTSTTLYKGDIELELVLDEPFWYAKKNILGTLNTLEGYYDENWIDANGKAVTVKDTPDALKIIYEDRIPLGSMTLISVFLGGDTYATVLYETYSLIAEGITEAIYTENINDERLSEETKAAYFDNGDTEYDTGKEYFPDNKYYRGSVIATVEGAGENETYIAGGKVGGATYTGSSTEATGITLPNTESANLYYAGTAPSPVKLSFTLMPRMTNYMISTPRNKYTTEEKPYNTISLTAVNKHDFNFTIPTLYASYNLVMKIFNDENVMAEGNAWVLVRETIRDTVRHPVVRAWANKMIDKYDNEYGSGIISSLLNNNNENPENVNFLNLILTDIKEGMSCLFKVIKTITNEENGETTESKIFSDEYYTASFVFDGKTGAAIGTFMTLDPSTLDISPIKLDDGSFVNDNLSDLILNSEGLATKTFVENVGDMVKSSYLILDERNTLDENFLILAWQAIHPDYAYLIEHDVQDRLMNLHFEFKNMYL